MGNYKLPQINKVFLVGNLTRDPELKYTAPNNVPIVSFGIAVNHRYKLLGEWKEGVSFFDVVAWNRLAELCNEYLHKGSAVLIDGELQNHSWKTNDGYKQNVVEIRASKIQFLDKKKSYNDEDSEELVEEISDEEN